MKRSRENVHTKLAVIIIYSKLQYIYSLPFLIEQKSFYLNTGRLRYNFLTSIFLENISIIKFNMYPCNNTPILLSVYNIINGSLIRVLHLA